MGIASISDTALWVAAFRARETERPDAIVRDPFARKLAGERGAELARTLPSRGGVAVLALRTRLIDDLVLAHVRDQGVDAVLNLAAGLDSRPYRLDLPAELRWIEVDLPPLLARKAELLAHDVPRCQIERVALDLADGDARRALFARVGAAARKVLVITEGLLIYLTDDMVRGLARDLHAQPSFVAWIADVQAPEALRYVQRTYNKALQEGNSRMQWALPGDRPFFEPLGWVETGFAGYLEAGRRFRRSMPGAWLMRLAGWLAPPDQRRKLERISGILTLGRATA